MNYLFKKSICVIISFLICCSIINFFACNNNVGNSKNEFQVFSDYEYNTGLNILGTGYDDNNNVSSIERRLKKTIKFERKDPVWTIAQWYSHYQLDKSTYLLTNDMFSISDISKAIEIDRKNNDLTLSMDASKEFNSVQNSSTLGSFWPHLLITQEVIDPVKIDDCEEMNVYIDFCINTAKSHAEEFGATKPGLQAQFAWFVYIKNCNTESNGCGEFLWFGFNLFDPTQLYAPHREMQDTAGGNLGNYIYTLGASESIGNKRVRIGEKTGFNINLKSEVEKGLESAHKAGFMTNTQIQDCYITGMNIGYEIFDVWEISTTISSMGISYTKKDN